MQMVEIVQNLMVLVQLGTKFIDECVRRIYPWNGK